jgi:aspartate-semialdehyde dehydrogenase
MSGFRIAIVGASGAVGREVIRVLEARKFPVLSLALYSSPRSAGQSLEFQGEAISLEALPAQLPPVDIVFACAGSGVAREYAPLWAKSATVIDNSSAFRLEADVPLIVPEVNPEAVRSHQGLIANPNCTTAILAVALWPLHQAFGVRRTVVSTYQAASGAGAAGMSELEAQVRQALAGQPVTGSVFPHPLAFNVIPQIDVFQENGYTKEEMKVVWETRKIFGEPEFQISATAVRVPVWRAHSEAVSLELARPATPAQARAILAQAPGVAVVDAPGDRLYPTPLAAAGQDPVLAGRIRESLVFSPGLELFLSGDQLLKGAALNAVQIAELL